MPAGCPAELIARVRRQRGETDPRRSTGQGTTPERPRRTASRRPDAAGGARQGAGDGERGGEGAAPSARRGCSPPRSVSTSQVDTDQTTSETEYRRCVCAWGCVGASRAACRGAVYRLRWLPPPPRPAAVRARRPDRWRAVAGDAVAVGVDARREGSTVATDVRRQRRIVCPV